MDIAQFRMCQHIVSSVSIQSVGAVSCLVNKNIFMLLSRSIIDSKSAVLDDTSHSTFIFCFAATNTGIIQFELVKQHAPRLKISSMCVCGA